MWLEKRGRPYAVMVPKTNAVPLGGRKKKKIEQHLERLPENAFSEVRPARDGSSGRRPWEWACVELAPDPEKGMRRWLLVRRSTDDPEEMGFYQAYGPEGTPIEELVRVCQERWAVEECFAEAKGEVGLDHYEVRRWDSWHRHVTLCLLAHAFLAVVVRSSLEREEGAGKRGGLDSGLIPPSVPEARKLLLAMAAPKRRRRFLLEWSTWRRAHQAVAARCRSAKRAARRALGTEGAPKSVTIALEEAYLTDEQWAMVRPLLPPQRGEIGRPPHEHREVLGGILWVARSGSSWREMPEEYGKWESAYRRHELWVKQGLWQRILRVLGEEDLPGPATKDPN